MKIYLATGNKNKKREMCELLPEHTILIPSDEGIDFTVNNIKHIVEFESYSDSTRMYSYIYSRI